MSQRKDAVRAAKRLAGVERAGDRCEVCGDVARGCVELNESAEGAAPAARGTIRSRRIDPFK